VTYRVCLNACRTLRFVFGEQMRIFMCVFWVGALGGCLALIEKLKLMWPSIPNILVRKYFHALSLLLFIPAILLEVHAPPPTTPTNAPPPNASFATVPCSSNS
jgi:hypothetical protein